MKIDDIAKTILQDYRILPQRVFSRMGSLIAKLRACCAELDYPGPDVLDPLNRGSNAGIELLLIAFCAIKDWDREITEARNAQIENDYFEDKEYVKTLLENSSVFINRCDCRLNELIDYFFNPHKGLLSDFDGIDSAIVTSVIEAVCEIKNQIRTVPLYQYRMSAIFGELGQVDLLYQENETYKLVNTYLGDLKKTLPQGERNYDRRYE